LGLLMYVRPVDVVALIEAGVIKQSDLRNNEIKDRAKADSFAKGFAVLQSTWVTCNIISRAAYALPISALQISTVRYVVCAVVAFAAWWHKPKDMKMPIVIRLPYDLDSDEMLPRVRTTLHASRRQLPPTPDTSRSVKRKADESGTSQPPKNIDEHLELLSLRSAITNG
jgi:hypothetical protein